MQDPKFLDVGGIRTRYFEKGNGPVLILIHGGQFGSYYSAYSWSLNFDILSKKFRVIAADNLGMGYTDNPASDENFNITHMLEHLYKFVGKLGIENANIVGHSRGAFLATSLVIEHPDLSKSLAIVDSNTVAPDAKSGPTNFYDIVDSKSLPVETLESVQIEAKMNSYSAAHATPDFCEEMLKISHLSKVILAREKMKSLKQQVFLPDLKSKKERVLKIIENDGIKIPTLVVWGYNDPSAPLVLGINLYNLLNKKTESSQFHVFNRCGHYCFREHPTEFNRLLENFIASAE